MVWGVQAGDLEELRGVVETCKAEGYSSAAVDYANTFILMVKLQGELESKVQANEAYELQVWDGARAPQTVPADNGKGGGGAWGEFSLHKRAASCPPDV